MQTLSLKLMHDTEEWGHLPQLAVHIDRSGHLLAAHPDLDVRAAYGALLERTAPLFEIEKLHGAGSLLNLDHPEVAAMATFEGVYFTEGELEAARRYRATRH